jgi:hypothetical protein
MALCSGEKLVHFVIHKNNDYCKQNTSAYTQDRHCQLGSDGASLLDYVRHRQLQNTIDNRVRLKQCIRFPLFEHLFHRISVLRGASRRGGGGGMLYVSGALPRTYTLFYPRPRQHPTVTDVTIQLLLQGPKLH